MQGLIRTKSSTKLAAELGMSVSTVRAHLQSIFRKLAVHSQRQLMAEIRCEDCVVPPPRCARASRRRP